MREGWEEITLKDASSKIGDGLHGTPSYSDDGAYFFVNGNNLKDGKIVISVDTKKIDEFEYNKIKKELSNRSILVAINGTLGNIGLYNGEKIALGKSACYVNVKQNISRKFIRYVLEYEHFQKYAELYATGSTIKNLGLRAVRGYKFLLPPLPTQRKIAAILSAYDDLIENNLKRIKLLEEKSQLTYEEWFVRMKFPGHETTPINKETGLPEGWEIRELQKIVELIKDSVLPESLNKHTPYIGLEHIPKKSFCLDVWETSEKVDSLKFQFKKGDILFGKIRPYFHKVGVALNTGITSTDTIVLRPKNNSWHGIALQTVFSNHFVDSATQSSNGTKMPRANWSVLKKYPVIFPSEHLIQEYHYLFSSTIKVLESLVEQNNLLREARDILLPRLMSGMIDVEEIEVKLEELETK
jgi:type I restriction enzyme S subunit